MRCLFVAALVAAVALSSCASAPKEVKWEYEKDAIVLNLKSDRNLNLKDKKAHALVICVYQLMSPNAFEQLSGSREGLYRLLECQVFDPASVSVCKQIVANPGKDVHISLDRAEGARYVALVAGYYTIERSRITRLYRIPEVSERKGFLWLRKVTKPGRLTIDLVLGALRLEDPAPPKGACLEGGPAARGAACAASESKRRTS